MAANGATLSEYPIPGPDDGVGVTGYSASWPGRVARAEAARGLMGASSRLPARAR
jgi:hypothetical protein